MMTLRWMKATVLAGVLFALAALSGQVDREEAAAGSVIQGLQPAEAPALTCWAPSVMGDIAGRDQGTPDPRNDINSVDALWILRGIVRLHRPLPGCSPEDMDCDGDIHAVDALSILRWIEYLPVYQNEPCPDIGTELH